MDLVSKSEVLHCSENLAKRIADLCRGRYLPVKVPGINPYNKGICGVDLGANIPTRIFLSSKPITASWNLRFSDVFINCARHGTENVSCSKNIICRILRRGVVIPQTNDSK